MERRGWKREEGDSSGPAWALSGPGPLHPGPKGGLGEGIVAQRVQYCGGWGGSLSDSLGFTLKGRQKPLCVQALTSSSTSHPTRSGPFKKKKKESSLVLGGSSSVYGSKRKDHICF